MSAYDIPRPAADHGAPGSGPSVRSQLRFLVILLVVLIPLGAGVSLAALTKQSAIVRSLTLALGPALEANTGLLMELTQSRTAWFVESVTGLAPAGSLGGRGSRVEVERLQHTLTEALSRPELSAADRARYAQLDAQQGEAIATWYSATSTSSASAPLVDPGRWDRAQRAWGDFADANTELGDLLHEARQLGRVDSRNATTTVSTIVVAVALVAVAGLLLGGWRLRGSVVRPLVRLSEVVRRQAQGDHDATADDRHGALEVRTLADDFNKLTRANARLAMVHREELRMRQLVLEVARGVRAAASVPQALEQVCRRLGEGLEADRILLYTIDDDTGVVLERSQWHRTDLPALPPLPPSLAQQVRTVAEQLRLEGSAVVLADVFDEDWAHDPRVLGFHRATGARSLVLAPIGSAEHDVGVLALLTVDRPRWWHRPETRAIEQSAGLAGQTIVQLRLAELREEQVRRLTELDRQKTDFMATVSHELRTPLTSINGYLELLEDGDYGTLNEGQRGALGIVQRNASRLRGLIEDLLVLNRIESTGLQASLEDVRLSDLVCCVIETIGPTAASGGVSLVASAVPDDVWLHVDRSQLERALINLGSNAVKFTPPDGTVTLEVEPGPDTVRITIADTGIGIPESDLGRLSERFFRAGNARSAAIPGTGLGLAIVRTIVEGHGGSFRIESVEGVGTSAHVVLPAA